MLDQAEKVIGYRFKDESILTEALTHASSADSRLESNERLEFLGDAILGFVVSEFLFRAFPDYQEGELTKIKSAVVSRRTCARLSRKMNLEELLNLGKGMSNRPMLPSSVAAAAFESIIAAIFLDGGLEPATKFILDQMTDEMKDSASCSHQDNFKSALQQYAQKQLPSNPQYVLLDEKGPDHAKCFEVCVEIDGRRFGSQWANSKKEAEQKAALIALCELDLASFDEEGQIVLHAPLTQEG